MLVLPVKPNSGGDDTRGALAELLAADDERGRLLACTVYARHGSLADPIYVHAKVGIVDDRWLTIGSANLNEHSLFNDTEMNIVCHDIDVVRSTRLRLWAEHLELGEEAVAGDPRDVVDRVLETDRGRATRTPPSRATSHAPTCSAASPLATIREIARPTSGATRRRLGLHAPLVNCSHRASPEHRVETAVVPPRS